MKKTLGTTVLACAMAIFGFAATLQAQVPTDESESSNRVKVSSGQYSMQLLTLVDSNAAQNASLTANLVEAPSVEGKSFGYLQGDTFVSLGKAVNSVQLPYNQDIRFGYGVADSENPQFEPRTVSLKVSSDPGYYGDYKADSFYQLDFSEDPFNGKIDIYVAQPLPAPAVTLLVALAAGAVFLLYKNRRQRFIQTEQA